MTPIAKQYLSGTGTLSWEPIQGAKWTVPQARRAYDLGEVEIVTKREGFIRTLFVVKRKAKAKRQPYFETGGWREMYYGGPSRGHPGSKRQRGA